MWYPANNLVSPVHARPAILPCLHLLVATYANVFLVALGFFQGMFCELLGTSAANGTIPQCIADYIDASVTINIRRLRKRRNVTARTPGPIVTYSSLPIVHALQQSQPDCGEHSWVGNGE